MNRQELIEALTKKGAHHCVLLYSLTNDDMVAMLEEFKEEEKKWTLAIIISCSRSALLY